MAQCLCCEKGKSYQLQALENRFSTGILLFSPILFFSETEDPCITFSVVLYPKIFLSTIIGSENSFKNSVLIFIIYIFAGTYIPKYNPFVPCNYINGHVRTVWHWTTVSGNKRS